ncbi:MAG TPA: cell division protein ZapE, partial [Wenzhouxiangella sp.]|nr:cell division protein ZapE [Wenzhouxiangella sp.]
MTEHGPLARYRALVAGGELKPDAAQEAIARRLQQRHAELLARPARWIDRRRQRHRPVRGLYLHGRVGRGKTLLMDLFADSLKASEIPVWRIHFHRFMDHVHDQLRERGRQRDPLPAIAGEIAKRCRVLCFDEFHVSDIADAMLLGGLLATLFERGLCLVATSNTAPRDLYAEGLQRRRFIPAIEAIETHCEVVHLEAATDYRLRELVRREIYYHPIDEGARSTMRERFAAMTRGERVRTGALTLRGRSIEPLRRAGPVVWFDFRTLCEGARSSGDY